MTGVKALFRTCCTWGCLCAALVVFAGCGPAPSPVQSPVRPLDLAIAAPVQEGGSDWASRTFQNEHLPRLIVMGSEQLTTGAIAQNFNRIKLDPAQLVLAESGHARVYFVSEASGYENALGINLDGVSPDSGSPRLIFPNATCNLDLYQAAAQIDRETMTMDMEPLGERSLELPLLPGDFVDLGTVDAGKRLKFFLINGKQEVFTVDPTVNADGVEHMTAFAIENTPYLMLSFEDLLGGGDRDYSDCVFLVELSHSNIEALIGKIDPWRRIKQMVFLGAVIAVLLGTPLTILYLRRRARLARERRLKDDVEGLMREAKPEEALVLLRSHRGRRKKPEPRWRKLEARVLYRMEATGDLVALEKETPEVIHEDEPLSIKVARAYVETEQWDNLHRLRESWRSRESALAEWLALDADELARHDQIAAARALLEPAAMGEVRNPVLLVRLAALVAVESPERAAALLDQAEGLASDQPDVHLYRGKVSEATGDSAAAQQAYARAMSLAPRNVFYRDHLAEFHRRQGDVPAALRIWCDGLAPPSMDFLWLKTAFWRKAAFPIVLEWPAQQPEGQLMSLVSLLQSLPANRFWDSAGFAPLAEIHTGLESRQEVFWLQLMEALRTQREDDALRLLNLNRFDRNSWYPDLEIALIHILTYRRLGFLDPKVGRVVDLAPARHPFFDYLHGKSTGSQQHQDETMERLLSGSCAFAAAFIAAGWFAAASVLCGEQPGPGYPKWFYEGLASARQSTPAQV